MRRHYLLLVLVFALQFSASQIALAQSDETTSLAQQAQNPVADLVSVPFQLNWNFDTGPLEKGQQVLNIQPVLPFELNEEWNLITRTILPVVSQPAFTPGQSRTDGIGDVSFTAFLSPKKPTAGGWIWGVGPVLLMDTASNSRLGQGAWSLGPSAVFLKIKGAWVIGALINNTWSVSTDEGRSDVNQMLIQPFINYNFPKKPGRYLTYSPVITANWKADSGNTWTVPMGLGIGQVMKLGKQAVNMQIAGYYNVVRPDFGSRWQIRAVLVFMFPK